MKALIIVDGWEKEMDIPDYCLEQGWVRVAGSMPTLQILHKQGCEVNTQELYQFDCSATGFMKNNLPIFEA